MIAQGLALSCYETHIGLAEFTLGTHLPSIHGGISDVAAVLALADSCALVASVATLGDTYGRTTTKPSSAASSSLSPSPSPMRDTCYNLTPIGPVCYMCPLLSFRTMALVFPAHFRDLVGAWPMASRSDSQPLKACDVTSRSRIPSTWPGAWPVPGPEAGEPLRMCYYWDLTGTAGSEVGRV